MAGSKGLMFVNPTLVPAETSLLDALGGEYLWWMVPDATVSGRSCFKSFYPNLQDLTLTPSQGEFVSATNVTQIAYADVEDQTLLAKALAELESEPARIFSDDNLFEPWNNGVEVGFFFTEQDQAIPLATQQAMASQFPAGYVSYSLNSSHSPFFSMPDEVVTGVVLAATEGMAKKLL